MSEEKKKRGRPKKVVELVAATPVIVPETVKPITGRANYGSNENRRVCHACGKPNSRIETIRKTGRITIRYRICLDCGRRRTTQETV